jgi:hypothetical protein
MINIVGCSTTDFYEAAIRKLASIVFVTRPDPVGDQADRSRTLTEPPNQPFPLGRKIRSYVPVVRLELVGAIAAFLRADWKEFAS